MSKAYVMGGKKRDGAGNRVGSGKAPRLKPGAKKPGAVKKAVRKYEGSDTGIPHTTMEKIL